MTDYNKEIEELLASEAATSEYEGEKYADCE